MINAYEWNCWAIISNYSFNVVIKGQVDVVVSTDTVGFFLFLVINPIKILLLSLCHLPCKGGISMMEPTLVAKWNSVCLANTYNKNYKA